MYTRAVYDFKQQNISVDMQLLSDVSDVVRINTDKISLIK